ncbi:MAG: hypothetical protein ACE5IH_06630, partial [Thermodesulfobacteriota bacterium]
MKQTKGQISWQGAGCRVQGAERKNCTLHPDNCPLQHSAIKNTNFIKVLTLFLAMCFVFLTGCGRKAPPELNEGKSGQTLKAMANLLQPSA